MENLTPLRKHIIDAIDTEGFDVPECNTVKEKLQFLADRIKSEQGYNINRIGWTNTVKEFYQGLGINIEYRNHVILEMAYLFGMIKADATESMEDYFLNNWFSKLANITINMFEEYKINY